MTTNRVFKKGDTVGLKASVRKTHTCPEGRENNDTADIRATYGNNGECWLDHDLHGCKYWNQEDLILIKAVEDKAPQ